MAMYVLVHGGFGGGWMWGRVTPLLRAAGHEVFTPTLTGLGERAHLLTPDVDLDTHIQDVIGVLEYEDLQNVILVGNSYSGMVITGVAERAAERLAHLVYIDAFVPRDGESMADLLDANFMAMIQESARTEGEGWRVPPMPLEMFGVTKEEDVRWIAPKMRLHPLKTVMQPVRITNPAAKAIPRTFVYCDGPALGLLDLSAERARAEGWRYHELAAPHSAVMTHPRPVAELLLDVS